MLFNIRRPNKLLLLIFMAVIMAGLATGCRATHKLGDSELNQAPKISSSVPLNFCNIKSMQKIGSGWYPRWHPTKDLIVFDDRTGLAKLFEIFTMKPDGTEKKCLTCDKEIPGTYNKNGIHGHRGEPAWDPIGNYIVFLATNEHGDLIKSIPGIGTNNDIFIMTADGQKFWQLTDMPGRWLVGGVEFSHDGSRLEWLEEYSCDRPTCPEPWLSEKECQDAGYSLAEYDQCRCCAPFDERSLTRNHGEDFLLLRNKIANIAFGPNGPVLSDIKTVAVNREGKRMLDHGSGFTPDDNRLIFKAADINETNGRPFCADIYTSNLNGDLSSFVRLTHTLDAHEENSEYSPDGQKIAYTSGHLVGYVFFKLDLYLMNADGSNKQRLTYFNEPGHPEYNNQLQSVGQGSWSNDGRQYIFHVIQHNSKKVNAADWSDNFCSGEDVNAYEKRIEWQKKHTLDIYFPKTNLYLITFEGHCGLNKGNNEVN